MAKIHLPQWLTMRLVVLELVLLTVPIILFAIDFRPVHAQGGTTCSGTKDYGDAPSSYGGGSYGDACASITAGLRIGSAPPDSETGSQYSPNADGDGADESFLNPLTPIDLAYPQYIWTVPISNIVTSTAYLRGWIDFNGNGSFQSNELASATVISGSTQVTLTWNIPITATPNITTYVRLRISTDSSVGPTGDYGNGEVEDYVVTTVQSIVCAPGTSFYVIDGTTTANGIIRTYDVATGSSTLLTDPPQATVNGIAVDSSRGFIYYQNATTSGSTITATGLFGYDVVAASPFTVTTRADLSPLYLPISNTVHGWRNASGAYGNGKYYAGLDGESSTPSLNQTGAVYEITLNSAGTAPISARVLVTPTGSSGGDTITNRVNWGDLIVAGNRLYTTYYVVSTSNYRHIFEVYDINSGLMLTRQDLGQRTDADPPQFGRDGNGQIWFVRNNSPSTATSVYTVTNNAVVGYPNSPRNTIGYNVVDASECPIVPMDFGDAPTSYGWDAGPLAARHGIVSTNGITPTLYLGSARTITETRDLHGFSSTDALGDDTHTYNGGSGGKDDEDSVTNIPRLNVDSTTYAITNVVVYNNTGRTATLYGWVDFNRDGVFTTTERVAVTVSSSASTQSITLTWSGLSGLVYGQSYLRLRLSTSTVTTSTWGTGNDGAFLATGYAPDGEVEDYPVPIDNRPTAVTLSSFNARGAPLNPGNEWIPISLITGATLSSVGGLIIYRRDQTRRRRRNL